ncbi:DUF11 domain-containing protein [Chryseobacterium sp.]|uniref:DUF11 domain-containing protein n=1 Tax=Chryseobacterium sp. TaxID=1871047 RepID=UPI0025C25656|nr:DUF11 domain-containing protein [Chryseobacterium sp.]MBV8326517.1 DUF11 domain-containing protein [Chryseobacterium sp.]
MDRPLPTLLFLIIGSLFPVFGQTAPNLEFATVSGDGNPTGNGPVTAATINFVKNTDNPTGTTFELYQPQLSATFTLTNQTYSNGVRLGWTGSAGALIYPLLNSAGAPANNNFTSAGATAGTGIQVTNNRGVNLTINAAALSGNATNGTYQMADLIISFNRPVSNPVLQIGGMGGFQGALGFTGGFDYISSNVPVSFSRLSGNGANFNVTSASVKNSATNPNATGTNSASGSLQINGQGITTLTLRISLRGDGNASSWTGADGITIGISTLESRLTITKAVNNQNPKSGTNVIFTLTAKNNGASNNTNVKITDLLPSGYTFISASTATGTYNSSSGIWNIGNLNDGASAVLEITAKVNYSGNYTNTAGISGDITDPDSSDNTSSSTPNVQTVCYEDKNTASAGINSKFGITTLQRAGASTWPGIRNSAHLVLESNTKGLVITRIPKASLGNITHPVEGMMVYDLTDKCLTMYADGIWSCFSTPSCP